MPARGRPARSSRPSASQRRRRTISLHRSRPRRQRPRVFGIERRLAHRMLAGDRQSAGPAWCCGTAKRSPRPPPRRWPAFCFHDRATFWKVLLDPNLQFGDAYSDGRLEVEGDLVALLETVYRSRAAAGRSGSLVPSALLRRLHRARANTLSGARENIHRHYDIGDDFYRLWLDDEMVYSGAYFADPAMTLDEAQRAKLDYVCRKLWLQAGRDGGRDRRRLGRAGPADGPRLRRHGQVVQHLEAADRLRPPPGEGRGARLPRRVHRGRLPQHHRPVRRPGVAGHVGARRSGATTASSAAWPTAASARPAAA